MKKLFLFLTALLMTTLTYAAPIEATPVDNISTYTGTEPFVYNNADGKYYAYNNLGKYEEYGVFVKTASLTIASATTEGKEVQFIRTRNQNPLPFINLNYIPKANTRIRATLMSDSGDDWKAAFGCGYEDGTWKDRFCFFTTNATINLGGETGNREAMYYYRKIVVDMDGATGLANIYDADGTTLLGTITDSPKTDDCKTPLYVFAQNKNFPNNSHIQTDCYNPYMTLYGMEIYEGATPVMNLVPYVTAEGKGGLKDKVSGTVYTSANDGVFEISDDLGVTVYEGKLVYNTTNGHLYQYTAGSFVDKGARTETELANEQYKDLRNWATNDGHKGVFENNIAYDNGSNRIQPYVGTGGHEPLMIKVPTEVGEEYNFSFTYSGSKYNSWHGVQIHTFVWNGYDLGTTVSGHHVSDQVLATTALPFAGATDMNVSLDFTAVQENETLIYQFGDGDDGDKGFWFQFDNLKVVKYGYPAAYESIEIADPNKYTELAYIESTGAVRENAFTTPYKATSKTEVDIKFQSYSGGSWRAIFSGRNGQSADQGISLYQNGDQQHFGYFVGGYKNDNLALYPGHNQDITVEATLGNLKVNDTDYPTGRTEFNASTRNISIFANPEWDQAFRGRIYYITLKEDGTTLYDFKPVMRHDGVFGYYDQGSRTFIQPAQGNWNGYGYKKLDDKAYVTYTDELRIAIVGSTAKYLPEVQNITGATFTWASSDESIATVAADGTVTGKKAGTVTITATTDADQGWIASYELTVSEPNYVRKDKNNVGYAIVTGGNGWGDSPLSALMDNNANTKFGCSGAGDAWAIMVASEPVAVKQYSFVTGGDTYNYPARNPRAWKLEGSNDNQTWTVINEHNDYDAYKIYGVNKEEFVFTLNNTVQYKFFKFSATSTGDGFQLGEFWINEQAHTWGDPTETASTCTVQGKKEWECTDCHALKTEALPLAAHNYENGECTVCHVRENHVVFLADGQTNPYTIKFLHKAGSSRNNQNAVDVETDWNTPGFDDSSWDELVMPIGSNGYDNGARNGAKYNTIWFNEDNTYWFRRTFDVSDPKLCGGLNLKLLHDDAVRVFVNGNEVFTRIDNNPWTDGTNWLTIPIDPSVLVTGKNVVAVYIEQNFGGAYCDLGLEASIINSMTIAGFTTAAGLNDADKWAPANGIPMTQDASKPYLWTAVVKDYVISGSTTEELTYYYKATANGKYSDYELPASGNQNYNFNYPAAGPGKYTLTFTANTMDNTVKLDIEKQVTGQVYFVNTNDWAEPYIWVWDANNNGYNYTGGTWPGVAMTKTTEQVGTHDVYTWVTYDITGTPTNLIFSNNGANQTTDLEFVNGATYNADGASTVTKTITAAGYATFCCARAVDFSSTGLTAYIAKKDADDKVTFSKVTKVPANTGVLLEGNAGDYTINSTNDTNLDNVTDNILIGVNVDTKVAAGSFVLLNGEKGPGFYKTSKEFTVGANTAYIAALANPARDFIWFGEETTGIGNVNVNLNDNNVYNLQGQRMNKAQKGLYIVNGKKVVIK